MPRQIVYIAPHQTSKVVAIVTAVLSLVIFVPLLALAMLLDPGGAESRRFSPIGLFLLPLFYLVFSYLVTVVWIWIFNAVAERTGGIELTLSDDVRPGDTTFGP